jgi:hypothetical protein
MPKFSIHGVRRSKRSPLAASGFSGPDVMETSMRKLLTFLIALGIAGLSQPASAQMMMTGVGSTRAPAAPIIDEQFTTGKHISQGRSRLIWSITRSTTKFVTDASGVLHSIAINTLPISSAGMLVEPAATNLVTHSQTFSTWAGFNAAATDNSGTAPDGTTTASLMTLTASGGQISSGWFRIWFTDGTTAAHALRVYGQNSGDNVYIWQGDAELGTVAPTSTIITTTASATRSADSIVIQYTGIVRMIFTFDDNSTQTITGINPATNYITQFQRTSTAR